MCFRHQLFKVYVKRNDVELDSSREILLHQLVRHGTSVELCRFGRVGDGFMYPLPDDVEEGLFHCPAHEPVDVDDDRHPCLRPHDGAVLCRGFDDIYVPGGVGEGQGWL